MFDEKINIAKELSFNDARFKKEFTQFAVYIFKKSKMTQAAFAAYIGVDPKTISRWVTGKTKCSIVNIFSIISIYGIHEFVEYIKDKYEVEY